ncbi:MAG TPA: rcc01693 family protein [Beijerinckiaceae bacterium]
MTAGAASEPSPFPWDTAMAFALGVLRWSPEEFWRATPRELAAAAAGLRGGAPAEAPSAGDLAALMRAFPD